VKRLLSSRLAVAAVVLAAIALLLTGCTPEEQTLYESINQTRVAHGLPALGWDDPAYAKAQAWAKTMADEQNLHHSELAAGLPVGWLVLGENVAVGSSPAQIAQDFLDSPHHLANILNPRFTRVAIGVVQRGDAYWASEVFIG
jgi:uncharacterized protein YkwD